MKILTGKVKPLFDLRGKAEIDLNGPELIPWHVKQAINLGASCGSKNANPAWAMLFTGRSTGS